MLALVGVWETGARREKFPGAFISWERSGSGDEKGSSALPRKGRTAMDQSARYGLPAREANHHFKEVVGCGPKEAAHPQEMGLKEALQKVNKHSGSGSGLEFMKDREKRDFKDLIGQEVVIGDIAFVKSKFNNGAPNVIFTITTDGRHFFRTGSTGVIEALKTIQKGLEEDGDDWNVVGVVVTEVESGKDGESGEKQTFYKVEARDFREEAAE